MDLTVKEVADKLQISKQAVSQRMDQIPEFKNRYVKKIGNRFEILPDGVKILVDFYVKNDKDRHQQQQEYHQYQQQEREQKLDDISKMLSEQVKTKDKQIDKLQKALDQQQQLQLATLHDKQQLQKKIDKMSELLPKSNENEDTISFNEDYEMKDHINKKWWEFWK